jgi:hypothetical protein
LKKLLIVGLILFVLFSLVLSGCGKSKESAQISTDALANLEYQIDITQSDTAKLENGSFSEEATPGSALKIEVKLTDDIAFGDLNNNGIDDAAAILWASGGGSGSFSYLSAVLNKSGSLMSTNSIFIGDKIIIENLSINKGIITVNYLDREMDQAMSKEPTI